MELQRTAWRNIWRNPRRSGVTVAAMTLALFVLILFAGLAHGFWRDMEKNIVEMELGDLQISAPGYRKEPDVFTRIPESAALVERLQARGFAAGARVLAWGLAAGAETSAGVQLRGIDVKQDAAVSRIHQNVAAGEWVHPAHPKGVVLGRRLARTLQAAPGAELVIITQGVDGANAYELLHVRGVLHAVGEATDRAGVFMPAAALREMLGMQGGAHQIIARKPAGAELAAAVESARAAAPGMDVQSWRALNPTLASMVGTGRQGLLFMYVIVYAAVAILILNAMLMAAYERIRELGVLKALGAPPAHVFALLAWEAALQALLAIGIGCALALPVIYWLATHGVSIASLAGIPVAGMVMSAVWYAEFSPAVFFGPVAALLCITALAACFPAAKAARIEAVAALRQR